MITTGFINLVYAFIFALTLPFRALPDVSLPAEYLSSIGSASGSATALDTFLPIATILSVFFLFILYETAYFGMKFINWVIRKIPGIS